MLAVKVNFEIGHEASLRSKKTPEGFTHDWEVFVRGQEGADISHFVDKVVFQLHETFPKPRRTVKEPPFTIKESGYAGFNFPIEIYLKNKDEPKKIKFTYDLTLQNSGFLKDRYVFQNPNEEFKRKLLKGGGIPVSSNTFYTNPDQETRSKDSFTEDKQQLLSKPKLSSESVKKHKVKEQKEEIPHRTSSFENLFGMPIQKPPKVSPDPKKLEKPIPPPPTPQKTEKKDKERSNTEKKSKHEHKESKPDKVKNKDDKEKNRSEKVKSHTKEQEKVKERPGKRPNERPTSPEQAKKRCLSPVRKPPSPPPRSTSASSLKEDYKILKQNTDSELRKPKIEEKATDAKLDKEAKEKKKKEKKSHDRDKDRKDKKESKKENQKVKEIPVNKEPPKEITKELPKARETPKETLKEAAPVKEKVLKPEKTVNKFSIENLRKTPPLTEEDKSAHHKSKVKSDTDRKHKHKKKDKKRDESRDKHKESSKEKKHKHEKVREPVPEKPETIELRETPVPKECPAPELASPISLDTASQCSSKSGIAKTSQITDDINSSHSDSENSIVNEEEEKPKIENPSPDLVKHVSPEPEPEPEVETEPEPVVEAPPQPKEKSKKHKDKSSKREEKRRKRKAAEDEDTESRKISKTDPVPINPEPERGESSGSVTEKVQDNGVSSSLGEEPESGALSPDYMMQLRDLQTRIMKIKNNEDLERVVNLIAETGRYEVTTQTFDFDLCLLDRSTVQQLIQLVGC